MDWEKFKKMFIYLLIALNIGLFCLNYTAGSKYKMTQEREAAIYNVLSSKGIGIYCDLIKTNKPMRSISVSTSDVDVNKLKSIFFEENEEVKTTLEFDKITLQSEKKTVQTQENVVMFYSSEGTGEIQDYSRETATAAAEEFVEKMMSGNNGRNTVENITRSGENYIFNFDDIYNGYKIFSNEKTVVVSPKGVIYAEAVYYDVENFTGESEEICGCDEALLTVMYALENESDAAAGKYIDEIELGYDFQDYEDGYDTAAVRLVPCYRIYVSGEDNPFTVNAYTNELIDG